MLDTSASTTVMPLIGITGHRRFGYEVQRLPAFVGPEPMEVFLSPYVRSVAMAGGAPVLLTREAQARAVVDRLDALVLAGGEDVDPRRYGAVPPATATFVDPGRDEMELALFNAAIAKGIPVLGICRGLQLINVARGGTLITDLPLGAGQSHAFYGYPGAQRTHEVDIEPDSLLADLLGTRLKVNSYHHQAIDSAGAGVRVVARGRRDRSHRGPERPGLGCAMAPRDVRRGPCLHMARRAGAGRFVDPGAGEEHQWSRRLTSPLTDQMASPAALDLMSTRQRRPTSPGVTRRRRPGHRSTVS